jgi:hypothetical protein
MLLSGAFDITGSRQHVVCRLALLCISTQPKHPSHRFDDDGCDHRIAL